MLIQSMEGRLPKFDTREMGWIPDSHTLSRSDENVIIQNPRGIVPVRAAGIMDIVSRRLDTILTSFDQDVLIEDADFGGQRYQ